MLVRQEPEKIGSISEDLALSVTVVICTHNRPLLLERCLRHLKRIDYHDFSVLVVDSAPKSSETNLVAGRYGANYRVSALKGLSRARNIGAQATQTDIIAYLDDDMIPHVNWLHSLMKEFSDKDVAAATGPMLDLKFADLPEAQLREEVDWGPCGPNYFHIDRSSLQWFERTNFGGMGDGNFALRRNAFKQIQGFDERLGRGAVIDSSEEHYAYFRLVESGFKIVYTPQAIVFHQNRIMTPELLRRQMMESFAYIAFLFFSHPSKSWWTIKFLFGGLFGARRWWRVSLGRRFTSLSFQDKVCSALNGLSVFLRAICQRPN
jgi:GT2 family glycosyltransferase